jgi:transglutaminase-like putative cysteine protease
MHLRIVHSTTFQYDGLAAASYNQARLTPPTGGDQIVAHSRIEVTPTPWSLTYKDYFGNEVTSFEVLELHDSLSIVATANVHTLPASQTEGGATWEELDDEDVRDRFVEYLTLTERVEPTEDFAELVDQVRAEAATPRDAALRLCELVHREVRYVTGATDVLSHGSEAWTKRSGVCQDFVHLVIGGLRRLGIPARYVSGYLHPNKDAVVGETVRGESHAWVEWWDGAWRGFDPTNDTAPGERHVVVAHGRDYDDVIPLEGIYAGAATDAMTVDVHVTRLA